MKKTKTVPYPEPLAFDVAQKLLKAATTKYPEIWARIREKAVARLQENNPEEIGSSDVSCAAIELIQRGYILLPGRYKLTERRARLLYFVTIKPDNTAFLTSAEPYAGRAPGKGQNIHADDVAEFFDVNQGVRAIEYAF